MAIGSWGKGRGFQRGYKALVMTNSLMEPRYGMGDENFNSNAGGNRPQIPPH